MILYKPSTKKLTLYSILITVILCSTQYSVKYSEIVLKFASVISASPVHSQGNNPYILEGTETFTLLVTFFIHYDYIFLEIKEFPLYWNFYQNYFCINKYFITVVTVTSSLRFLYHTVCMNFYTKDGQDCLHFGYETHLITISSIILHRLIYFKSQDFKHYPFLNYIYISYIFSTEIKIIFNCDGVAATQHNICNFVVL